MAVYKGDNPVHFRTAMESITIHQKLQPSELVLSIDGPITVSMENEIKTLQKKIPYIKVIRLPKNMGLGIALKNGMENASYDVIARMDSDDIALPDRLEKQYAFLEQHPECDMVGGQISEFISEPGNVVGKRIVPTTDKEIHEWLKKRCPSNHMTVMMCRQKVLDVGNYVDWHYNEDYYLWIRMAEAGCKFANLPDNLVNVRVGKEMYQRRGGWKYFKSEKGLQDYMLKHRIISLPRYLFNVAVRFGVQVAMPNKVRGFIFQKLFRKR